ncbi:hypothetical protein BG006_010038 [Podila minutissima]|uniref:Cytochrome b5 heme-binding domain-containing protein n=1 Tax=Podila minutissima TaxID=64525 RepID=A0A9P5SGI4_9FUNG|nr:hypothetical protein BG006_010038 [Podila minutissima]
MSDTKARQRVRSKDGVRVGAHHDGHLHSQSKKQNKEQYSGKGALVQTVLLGIVFFFLSSYLVTDTWLWGYSGKYSNWRRWIPGGGYGFFSGKDASRAYTTGCFQTHLTHDLRGLTPAQLADIDGWANFYRNHAKYYKVGTVILDPIDPLSPLPVDCRAPSQPKPAS